MSQPIMQIKDLRFYYHTEAGPVKAVDGVSFDLERGSRLGLVGESGCGKSTLAMAIMRLLKPPGRLEAGEIWLDGVNLAQLSEEEMRKARLNQISLIPQGAMNSLNPVVKVRDQVLDGMEDHSVGMTREQATAKVDQLLEAVDLAPGAAEMYPHELSGGMKQRVCVAIAISMRPKVILADEPTSALDVVVQRQIMETIERLQEEMGISMILIGHDMGLMAQSVDKLAVMYSGKLAEIAGGQEIFAEPLHPYTRLLISTLPTLERKGEFRGIPGITPSLLNPAPGCLFSPRCPEAKEICSQVSPVWQEIGPGRWVACHLYGEGQ